jgi:hypothetical protein
MNPTAEFRPTIQSKSSKEDIPLLDQQKGGHSQQLRLCGGVG